MVEKSVLKAGAANDIGADLEDMLEAAGREVLTASVSREALLRIAKTIEELHLHAGKDLDEGKLEGLEPPQVAELLKKYVTRAAEASRNVAVQYEAASLRAVGKQEALRRAVDHVKKYRDSETAKIGLGDGARPPPMKVVRQAEERADGADS